MSSGDFWDGVYRTKGDQAVSWYQPDPDMSMRMLRLAGLAAHDHVVDIGGGASRLVDHLLDAGVAEPAVVDVSDQAMSTSRDRLGPRAARAQWIVDDVRTWVPLRRFDLWHDRAVFHFLTDPADRDAYRRTLASGLADNGRVVIATFAADGPTTCSGLPVIGYTPDDLAAEFPGYTVLHEDREEHHTPSDQVQPFTWLILRA